MERSRLGMPPSALAASAATSLLCNQVRHSGMNIKLSAPQRRRRRLQRQAVRESVVNTNKLKGTYGFLQSEAQFSKTSAELDTSLLTPLQRLEGKVDNLHYILDEVLMHLAGWGDHGDWTVTSRSYPSQGVSPEAIWEPLDPVGHVLNALAPEFQPQEINTATEEKQQETQSDAAPSWGDYGNFRSMPSAAWEKIYCLFDGGKSDPNSPETVPQISEVANSSPFRRGDVVFIASGDLRGHVGTVERPGNDLTVKEAGKVLQFKGLCSVNLENDPAGFSSRPLDPQTLQTFYITRQHVQQSIDGCLRAMEAKLIPERCHQLLTPLLRKAMEIAKAGTPKECETIEHVLSERLSQLASDIFENRSPV